jgi:hypothetical protein
MPLYTFYGDLCICKNFVNSHGLTLNSEDARTFSVLDLHSCGPSILVPDLPNAKPKGATTLSLSLLLPCAFKQIHILKYLAFLHVFSEKHFASFKRSMLKGDLSPSAQKEELTSHQSQTPTHHLVEEEPQTISWT